MILDLSNKFSEYLLKAPVEVQTKAIEVLLNLYKTENISQITTTTLLGFPYIHKIEIENYSFCFYAGKDKLEILGLVEQGTEMILLV